MDKQGTPTTTQTAQQQTQPQQEPINEPTNRDNQTDIKSDGGFNFRNFKSVEDLKKSYEELEKTHYQKLNEFHQLKQKVEQLENPKKSLSEILEEKLSQKSYLDDNDRQQLKELGYTDEVIDIVKSNIESSKALKELEAKQKTLEALEILGEQRNEIVEFTNELFSGDYFSEQEKAMIQNLNENNPSLLAKISKMLYEGYQAQPNSQLFNPYTQRMGSSQDKFTSEKELQQAMRDPRFSSDRAFRDAVMAKARRSFTGKKY